MTVDELKQELEALPGNRVVVVRTGGSYENPTYEEPCLYTVPMSKSGEQYFLNEAGRPTTILNSE